MHRQEIKLLARIKDNQEMISGFLYLLDHYYSEDDKEEWESTFQMIEKRILKNNKLLLKLGKHIT